MREGDGSTVEAEAKHDPAQRNGVGGENQGKGETAEWNVFQSLGPKGIDQGERALPGPFTWPGFPTGQALLRWSRPEGTFHVRDSHDW